MALRPHAAFLDRAEPYFGLVPGSVVYRWDDATPDIACYPTATPPVVLLGEKWRHSNPRVQKVKIVHENLHIAVGLPDNIAELGYWSNPRRDTLSLRVYEDIISGNHSRFDARRFGVDKWLRERGRGSR